MSTDSKFVVRFAFWLLLVMGVVYSPFAWQDYTWHVCRQEFSTVKDQGNCYWQQMYGENIYK